MEVYADSNYEAAIEAMNELLVRIGRLENLIRAHQAMGDGESVSVENWREMKARLVRDLVETINDLNLDLRVEMKMAA